MTVDVEAGGALVTAGLAAKTIDAHSKSAALGDVKGGAKTCANCNAALLGAYCHACGQTAHVHRSLWHMIEEGLHGVLHFDSKSWRTLPLLIARPGLLTRRYIEGQRVRYVSPLALFLFMIFLMFFVVSSVTNDDTNVTQATPEQRNDTRTELVAQLEQAKADVAEKTAAHAAATDPAEKADTAEDLEEAKIAERTAAALLSLFDKSAAGASGAEATVLTAEEVRALTGWNFGTETSEVLSDLKDNPDLYFYKFRNSAYKFSFMLIPISLPFLWLMFFWRRNVTAYDHIVFSLYSLSFMSLLFIVVALMGTNRFTAPHVGWLLLAPPVHMFVHLRGTYVLSNVSALWRTLALLMSAGTVFVLFIVLIAVISYL
jgi:hypothetical protein